MFVAFQREENHQHYLDRKYLYDFDLIDEELANHQSLPSIAINSGDAKETPALIVDKAIESLLKIQRRRFLVHYEEGMTFAQIADAEGCTKRAAARFVYDAQKNLKKLLSDIWK